MRTPLLRKHLLFVHSISAFFRQLQEEEVQLPTAEEELAEDLGFRIFFSEAAY